MQITVSPILKIFSLLTDNFIKKTHNFINTCYEGINEVWSKNRNDKKG
jgi:hypothetical protein